MGYLNKIIYFCPGTYFGFGKNPSVDTAISSYLDTIADNNIAHLRNFINFLSLRDISEPVSSYNRAGMYYYFVSHFRAAVKRYTTLSPILNDDFPFMDMLSFLS